VDGYTIYTDRFGRKVFYAAAPPSVPATPLQLAWRARFALGMQFWRQLSPAEKAAYRRVCDAASFCMLGHNLWLHLYVTQNTALRETLQRQYRIQLASPPIL
jgi:hypothetical protein